MYWELASGFGIYDPAGQEVSAPRLYDAWSPATAPDPPPQKTSAPSRRTPLDNDFMPRCNALKTAPPERPPDNDASEETRMQGDKMMQTPTPARSAPAGRPHLVAGPGADQLERAAACVHSAHSVRPGGRRGPGQRPRPPPSRPAAAARPPPKWTRAQITVTANRRESGAEGLGRGAVDLAAISCARTALTELRTAAAGDSRPVNRQPGRQRRDLHPRCRLGQQHRAR